ncbi:MAG: 4'-phosphopantetheinyl transferase superfamily protein [Actinomycetia bacterium]|nr:4'-phosphopantetheinyl transferase superfamily protein [Actinomycetes bacterium]
MEHFRPLLPSGIQVADTSELLCRSAEFDSEARVIAAATEMRRTQFLTGRKLARQALAAVGGPPGPIGRDPRGAPIWPPGFVGSITHTPTYAGVAVARADRVAAIGIDAEPLQQPPREIIAVVTSPVELHELSATAGEDAALLAFVAKEAVFKAWWPLTGDELDFADVRLRPSDIAGDVGGGAVGARTLLAEFSRARPALRRHDDWLVRWRITEPREPGPGATGEQLLLAAVTVSGSGSGSVPGPRQRGRGSSPWQRRQGR